LFVSPLIKQQVGTMSQIQARVLVADLSMTDGGITSRLGRFIDKILTPKYVDYPPYEGAQKVCTHLAPAPEYRYENKYKELFKAYKVQDGTI
jgi:hypothetical protein